MEYIPLYDKRYTAKHDNGLQDIASFFDPFYRKIYNHSELKIVRIDSDQTVDVGEDTVFIISKPVTLDVNLTKHARIAIVSSDKDVHVRFDTAQQLDGLYLFGSVSVSNMYAIYSVVAFCDTLWMENCELPDDCLIVVNKLMSVETRLVHNGPTTIIALEHIDYSGMGNRYCTLSKNELKSRHLSSNKVSYRLFIELFRLISESIKERVSPPTEHLKLDYKEFRKSKTICLHQLFCGFINDSPGWKNQAELEQFDAEHAEVLTVVPARIVRIYPFKIEEISFATKAEKDWYVKHTPKEIVDIVLEFVSIFDKDGWTGENGLDDYLEAYNEILDRNWPEEMVKESKEYIQILQRISIATDSTFIKETARRFGVPLIVDGVIKAISKPISHSIDNNGADLPMPEVGKNVIVTSGRFPDPEEDSDVPSVKTESASAVNVPSAAEDVAAGMVSDELTDKTNHTACPDASIEIDSEQPSPNLYGDDGGQPSFKPQNDGAASDENVDVIKSDKESNPSSEQNDSPVNKKYRKPRK